MSCACGHHHPRQDGCAPGGTAIPLARPMIALNGRLICTDAAQMMTALSLLPDHVELSRAEPGCLHFDIRQDDDPLIWNLAELFTDEDAFAAHKARTGNSLWGQASGAITRDFHQHDILPAIRAETATDHAAIDALLQAAFEGPDEARLVRLLRDQGDLSLSLVAHAAGTILGHVALSPIGGDRPALALAPVAVTPRAQRLGIGSALIRDAIARSGGLPIVVLGDPAYYGRFGFAPADLDSVYAGPCLQTLGDLPQGCTIRHAPAFAAL
ncbi:GNAT family N-acetyltransferase [Paracoccus marinaquae]|uniref:GNAT family N-acetyltransferase n=1 Tax=Paracoccus marinaquae TaxID=2841926 RepID=A0ABS6AJU2_9RHOB|nr:GNAT family N-acetyltransferase [Paracoccus marinaquae]MBU3029920.1 GNAT family N-acetyltransferase [Paracoccus marinaquae]